MNIAIIPARLGSKRIKEKNIRLFFSKPMIQWTYETLKKSKIFKKIYISTESEKIIRICKKFGAKNFIKRSKELSSDNVPILPVVKDSIIKIDRVEKFENICCAFPCNPFLKISDLKKALKYLRINKKNFVHTVVRYTHPPERALYIKKNNELKVILKKNLKKNTNSFRQQYYDIGQFYFAHKKVWLNNYMNTRRVGIKKPIWSAVDIDNQEDFELAKFLFNKKKIRKNK